MKKNLLIAALLSSSATGAMAQSAFEGFYGQLGIGYESTSVSFTGGTVLGRGYSASANNSNSFTGTVSAGAYFAVTPSFLLGVGAEYSPIPGSKANATVSVPSVPVSATTTYNKKDSYNLFISPALVIDKDKLAYAKVGFTGVNIQSGSTNENSSYTGYSLGLGYKQIINGGLYGFGEINYAAYGSQSDGSGFSGTNKPTATNFLVGVGYKF